MTISLEATELAPQALRSDETTARRAAIAAAAALLVSTLPMPIVQAVGYPTYAEQFPTRVRYTGMAISFNVAAIIGGGFTPYLSTWLTSATEIRLMPGFLLAGGALIALVTLLTIKETSREALD